MTSVDANLLLFAFSSASPEHERARAFLAELGSWDDVALSEFILQEFYLHFRNPAVLRKALSAPEAVAEIQAYRRHPRWKVVGFPPTSLPRHEALWQAAARRDFPRRRIDDARTALALRAFGVTRFATANVRDFEGLGFDRVWNPLEG
jgi:predicted nucleic acid-binding protein